MLSLAILVTSLGMGTSAFALENSKRITVTFSIYDGKYTMQPDELEVNADFSKWKGYNDGNPEDPTILDAMVSAESWLHDGYDNYDHLQITDAGWITRIFGKDASNFSYRVNGNYATGVTETIQDGDYLEFMFYQDTTYWSDNYTYFDSRSKEVFRDTDVTLTLSKVGWGDPSPAANANITVFKRNTLGSSRKTVGKTDENGNITLNFDEIGTYQISAENNIDGTPIFAPWCEIKVTGELLTYVEKEISGGAAYLLNSVKSFDVTNAVDYLTYLKSGADMSKYNKAFLASVKANLDKNGGKLVTPAVAGYGGEMGIYGAVIQILDILGKDATDFEGYNLVEGFESLDLSASYHPYYYRVAIEAANETYAKALCDKYIADFYVLGSGLNYWGFSCDNTAHFLTSIAKYKNDYAEYVEDAKAVLKTYTKENGAFCDPQWAPEVNTDSTALAMMAFASIGELDNAFEYYKNLVEGFESIDAQKTGVFLHSGVENAYATKDALLALEYFKGEVAAQKYEHPEDVAKTIIRKATPTSKAFGYKTVYTCILCPKVKSLKEFDSPRVSLASTSYVYTGTPIEPRVIVVNASKKAIAASNYDVKYSNNTAVGTGKVTVTFKGDYYTGSITKTFKINPKRTNIKSVTPIKKGFKVVYNKQASQTTGYQVQVATDKNFSKNRKTFTVGSKKTLSKKITGLKAKNYYYVRVRTYKKNKDGNYYYSGWSAPQRYRTN